ncbi:hypothetical protein AKJ52_02325 [candidate division MSBL1 archaeon SCGC-AAA382C18]|uniref:Acyl-protein synthetase LuxE domain-containing protein n=1 Tax=candidate division MSBL1 archaeon SCGC-AAA382C18 TaxID=1698281 RepID=A0A133VIN9_9EURY|nr:hypothetical protein AKJ52_02325 [candidate division MSBL1 archaeon SCGC-AAA382C18]
MLTPSPENTEVGMVQGMDSALRNMNYSGEEIEYMVQEDELKIQGTLNRVEEKSENGEAVHIYGPPFAFMDIIEYIENNGVSTKVTDDSRLLTTGGWKGVEGKVPREEFIERLCNAFSSEPEQYRDTYGLTDVMAGMVECEEHNKHVPPWIHASAKNPDDLNRAVEEGKEGLMSFKSSIIGSYPAFTLPGDMTVVYEDECDCGRNGQIVEHRGRASAQGQRGCAIKLDEFMESIT